MPFGFITLPQPAILSAAPVHHIEHLFPPFLGCSALRFDLRGLVAGLVVGLGPGVDGLGAGVAGLGAGVGLGFELCGGSGFVGFGAGSGFVGCGAGPPPP